MTDGVLLHIEAVKQEVFLKLYYRECIARECYKEQQVACMFVYCTAAVGIAPRQFQDSLWAYNERPATISDSSIPRGVPQAPVRLQEWHYRSVHYDPIESREATVIIVLQVALNAMQYHHCPVDNSWNFIQLQEWVLVKSLSFREYSMAEVKSLSFREYSMAEFKALSVVWQSV